MTAAWSRREVVTALAVGGVALRVGVAAAQSDDVLERLRKAGVVKIGMANQPPYSGLKPDGSVTGLAPTLVKTIMAKFGVNKVEGVVAPYGQLIPGLQAGRWDMIGASLTITKERCAQVRYSDPITLDGGTIAYIKADQPQPPKSYAEIGSRNLKIGMLTGSYLLKKIQSLGVPANNILQFPDNPSLIDGLLAKRMNVAVSTYSSVRDLQKARRGAFEFVYPVPDDPPHGGGCAFRPPDTSLYEAFQRELRALKKSGEFMKIGAQFGFELPPEILDMTAEGACAAA